MKEYNFFKLQGAVRPTEEQLLDTKLFYQNSVEIYARFNDCLFCSINREING